MCFVMATIHNLKIFKFLNYQIVGRRSVGTTNVHRRTNFIKSDQMIAEISDLTTVKMVALRHLGFLKI